LREKPASPCSSTGWVGASCSSKASFGAAHRHLVAAIGAAPHAPVLELDVGVAGLGPGQAEAFARAALVVQQASRGRIGQRGVADDQLLGREGAGVGRVVSGAAAEEGDLEAERLAVGVFSQPVTYHHSVRCRGGRRSPAGSQRAARRDRGEGGGRRSAAPATSSAGQQQQGDEQQTRITSPP
jgi:hypothetical protein